MVNNVSDLKSQLIKGKGLCECGCGLAAPISQRTDNTWNAKKGKPRRFIQGHGGRKNFIERFNSKYIPVTESGCWIWESGLNRGYGAIFFNKNNVFAHRISFILHKGDIPDGMLVLHKCDNTLCVNPHHLYLGRNKDNVDDMLRKGRSAKGTKQHLAKLDNDKVIQIRYKHDVLKIKKTDLAREFCVSFRCIEHVVKRLTWKHVP